VEHHAAVLRFVCYLICVSGGGDFQALAQKVWNDPGRFFAMSFKLLCKAGLMVEGVNTVDCMIEKHINLKENYPLHVKSFSSSILNWSFENENLWRGYVPIVKVLPKARSIALTLFQEDRGWGATACHDSCSH